MALIDGFHIELGIMVARKWKLSPLLHGVIEFHHRPHLAPANRPAIELVAASDGILALLESHSSITASDLAAIPQLGDPSEVEYIAEMLPQIPPLVVSLLDISPQRPTRDASSKVSKPVTTLHGAVKPRLLPGTWLRNGVVIPVQVLAISPDGFLLEADERPKDNFLMRFKLELPDGVVDLCGNSTRSSVQGKKFWIEVRVFGVGGKVKEAWSRLYTAS
jgi:hypothetical protein